ncbi:Spermatogenesis-associated protein 20 [Carpediemonas membranifera]|uniref:Spermatogenesis-associated protein 20 n=1 Tax=Carpediemonas membranifera TaxID=201153 RepID=A0A8J6B6G5_9EUKA|nr:Spermatogenesis-associated protein 20 [Carpediemonas membranifera]|eukprot:KAG9390987.1 Spermatogenesis-associated protein 20 [Carpediemonas membranifera]
MYVYKHFMAIHVPLLHDNQQPKRMLPKTNLLKSSLSKYLQEHAANPVHWREWSDAAIDEAKALNRPIFLSVGYSSCHWCHVMAKESFENDHVAKVLNDNVVAVKVDREELPSIDEVYQMSLHAQGKQGGWPLSVFLDPKTLRPFYGATYLPPFPNSFTGAPGLVSLVEAISKLYRESPDEIEDACESIAGRMEILSAPTASPDLISTENIASISEDMMSSADPVWGGFGRGMKFPQTPMLLHLIHSEAGHDHAVATALHMISGGIYDHIGGGIYRYATRADWNVPHFEKMADDQGRLLQVLARMPEPDRDACMHAAGGTIDFLHDVMAVPYHGATLFAASLDADSEGKEGQYYTWAPIETHDVLAGWSEADATDFCKELDLMPPNWGEVSVPRRNAADHPDRMPSKRMSDLLASGIALLKERRSQRSPPERDDKVILAWNAQIATGMLQAGMRYSEPGWVTKGLALVDGLLASFCSDDDMPHMIVDGQPSGHAFLDDLALLSEACLVAYGATADERYLKQCTNLVHRLFADHARDNGLTQAPAAHTVLLPTVPVHDAAQPAANGIVLLVLARLFSITAEPEWQKLYAKLHTAIAGARDAAAKPTILRAVRVMAGMPVVHCPVPSRVTEIAMAAGADVISAPELSVCGTQGCQTATEETIEGVLGAYSW